MRVDYRRIAGIRNRRNAILVRRVSKSRRLIGARRSAIAKRVGESERGRKGGNMTVRRPEAARVVSPNLDPIPYFGSQGFQIEVQVAAELRHKLWHKYEMFEPP